MSKTRKIHAKLHDGQSFMVMSVDDFYRIADTFDVLAGVDSLSADEQLGWKAIASRFRQDAKDNAFFDDDTTE